jgi:hypothetical protein
MILSWIDNDSSWYDASISKSDTKEGSK